MAEEMKFCTACGDKLERRYADPDNLTAPYYRCMQCLNAYYDNPTVGVAVIHTLDTRILLGKRKSSYRDNLWCIPCGHLDAYEPVQDGAKREFLEETSLSATELELFDVRTNPNNTVGIYYIATIVTGQLVAGDDLAEVAYFDFDDLPHMAFVSDLAIINKLKKQST